MFAAKRPYSLGLAALVAFGVVLSMQHGSARDLLVSRVILGNPDYVYGRCPNYDAVSYTGDEVRYPAGGEYSCPNGNHGYLGADPNPLVGGGAVICAFGVKSCGPRFAAPTTGSDSQGPYASVDVTERSPSLSGCNDGATRNFKTHTTNIYDTSYECRPPDPPPPPPCGYGGCSDWSYTNQPCGEEQQTGTSYDQCGCWQCLSPIIVRIKGEGVPRLSNAQNGVLFDLAGKGETIQVAWPVDDSSGWLVMDRNGNGAIDDGRELFGTSTPLESGGCGRSGYQALGELDINHDGDVAQEDPRFQELRLWIDRIRNGRTDPGELIPLSALDIVSLHTTPKESRQKDRWGNLFRYRADVRATDGSIGKFSYDVFPGTAAAGR